MKPWFDGEIRDVPGKPYKMKFIGGVYSCSCVAWKMQSTPIDKRSCKHLKVENGEAFELARIGAAPTATSAAAAAQAPTPALATASPGAAPPGAATAAAITARAAAQGRALRPDEKAKLNGPPVLLAHSYEDYPDVDPTGWWQSEKLDGVRAYWDGTNFISRQGNIFHAPDWFKKDLPDEVLDGELWVGRKKFDETISIVKSFDSGDRWKAVRYVIFDAPNHGGPFEERMAHVRRVCENIRNLHINIVMDVMEEGCCYVVAHPHKYCLGLSHLKLDLHEIEQLGGEGLMIRKPGSKYVVGRSDTLLKVKPFKDAEAVVIEHKPGKGRHLGRLGGLEVRMPSGVTFTVGTGLKDKERNNPPPIGATITYRYTELTKDGKPKCASFVAVRDYE